MAKTPPEEYDEIYNRVSKNVAFPEDTFTVDELIKEIDEQYPLTGKGAVKHPKEHRIYEEIGIRGKEKVIQPNLSRFIEENYPKREWIATEKERDLTTEAKGIYSSLERDKFLKDLEELPEVKELIPKIVEETKAEEEDVKISLLHPLKEVKKEIDLTMELAEKSDRPSTVGIFRREDIYDDVLELFKKPRSSYEVAKILQDKGLRTDVSLITLGRDIRRLNLPGKDLTEYIIVKGVRKQKLTTNGEEILKRLK